MELKAARQKSLPLRERGLKLAGKHRVNQALRSLPLRERGLKYDELERVGLCPRSSLPLRERGLKFSVPGKGGTCPRVAPLAGAWIEIPFHWQLVSATESLPLRERGLKCH